jgi:nucleoside 2-deoxyribosyltransferase
LQRKDPQRKLYLALPAFAQTKLERIPPLLDIIKDFEVKVIYFDSENKTIISWEK